VVLVADSAAALAAVADSAVVAVALAVADHQEAGKECRN
jgi:hypothetical protein